MVVLFPTLLAISFHSMLYEKIQVRDCQIICVKACILGYEESS